VGDSSAAGLAAQYMEDGYTHVKVLDKGINGWKESGFNVL
jgi:rhodanese-related sulfurtransferase